MLGAAAGAPTPKPVWWLWLVCLAFAIGIPACAWLSLPAQRKRRELEQKRLMRTIQK